MSRKNWKKYLAVGLLAAALTVPQSVQADQWVSQSGRWWYQYTNGGYPASTWKYINNKWYYFDAGGWMTTGWQKVSGKWYYMNNSGAMTTGWQKVSGKWYYMNSSGAMTTGWQKVGGKWYYMNNSGAMTTGWQKVNGKWYYMNNSGAMTTGWQKVNGKWYYMNSSGAMTTGWQKVSGKWYYMNGSGAMLTGWQQIGGKWYYLYADGHMAANETIGTYRVNGDGVWEESAGSGNSSNASNSSSASNTSGSTNGSGTTGNSDSTDSSANDRSAAVQAARQKVCDTAAALIGTDADQYIWGGNGPQDGGVDCSGLLIYAFTSNGYNFGARFTANAFAQNGQEITREELEPGDAIATCYNEATGRYQHILLYIGNNMVIAAECGGSTVCSEQLECNEHVKGTICNCGINRRSLNEAELVNAKYIRLDAFLQ